MQGSRLQGEKGRVAMRDQCDDCQYRRDCFIVLKYWMTLSSTKCKQGRFRRKGKVVEPVDQVTLGGVP
jgi:hypothetical protein